MCRLADQKFWFRLSISEPFLKICSCTSIRFKRWCWAALTNNEWFNLRSRAGCSADFDSFKSQRILNRALFILLELYKGFSLRSFRSFSTIWLTDTRLGIWAVRPNLGMFVSIFIDFTGISLFNSSKYSMLNTGGYKT